MKIGLYAAAFLLLVAPALAQDNLIVNIPGDNTCSTVKGEAGFNALSWSIGGSDAGTITKSGIVNLQVLSITKTMDACSEKLIRDFLSGTFITSMTLIQYQTSPAGPYAAATVTLTNAYVASWSVGGTISGLPSEAVSFSFSKMCVATISLTNAGQIQPQQQVCYDAVNRIVSSK